MREHYNGSLTYPYLRSRLRWHFESFRFASQQMDGTDSRTWGRRTHRHIDFCHELQPPLFRGESRVLCDNAIVPGVSGIVTKVHVEPNQRLDKDDIMFQIDPIPYENKVKQLNAQLVAALDDQVRARELMVKGVGRQRDLDIADAQVDSLEAQMNSAQYDLSRTTVRAPGNGYVTQFSLRPGIMAVSMPLRPVAVFVQDESGYLIAWFRQNSMQRLQVGYEAEVAYDGILGTVFKSEILAVLRLLAEGQIQPTGNLMTISSRQPGRIPVRIRITDERLKDYTIPGGAYAQTAVYSDHLHHVAIMRRILLRISSWMNYLFPFH